MNSFYLLWLTHEGVIYYEDSRPGILGSLYYLLYDQSCK